MYVIESRVAVKALLISLKELHNSEKLSISLLECHCF